MDYTEYLVYKSLIEALEVTTKALGDNTKALITQTTEGIKEVTVIDDLNTTVAALTAEVTVAVSTLQAGVNDITSLVGQLAAAVAANNPTQIAAASAQLTAATATLKTGVDAMAAVLPPAANTP